MTTLAAPSGVHRLACSGLGGINTNANTVAAALAGAAAIFDTPSGLTNAGGFTGLSNQQMSSLANWGPVNLRQVVTNVPTLSEWALILLSLLVASVAAHFLRRRRHEGEDLHS